MKGLVADLLVNAIVERICISNVYDALQPFLGESDVFIGYLPGVLVSISIWSDFDWKSSKGSRKRFVKPMIPI